MSTKPHTPNVDDMRAAWVDYSMVSALASPVAEFDRFINKVKADALREAGADVMGERLETETEAGNWLDERADRIEANDG